MNEISGAKWDFNEGVLECAVVNKWNFHDGVLE